MGCFGYCRGTGNRVADYDDEECDFLCVGLEGSGKTVLIRRLQSLHNPASRVEPKTFPTMGTETNEIACQRHQRFRKLTSRELGGCMAAIWHKYFEECRSVLYVLDASNPSKVPAAVDQLLELLGHPSLKDKSCLLVLNKVDAPASMSRSELDPLLRLQELQSACTGRFDVLEASALEGHGRGRYWRGWSRIR